MSCTKDESVVVRVWLPRGGFSVSGEVGHASLETLGEEGIYASFWPAEAYNFKPKGVAGDRDKLTLEDDIANEGGRPPDVEVELRSLDVPAINAAYAKFVSAKCNWSIWGSAGFLRDPEARNCSGLVLHLLSVGGLGELLGGDPDPDAVTGSSALALLQISDWRTLLRFASDYLTWIKSLKGLLELCGKRKKWNDFNQEKLL
jgi:hypothetical protein